MFPLSLVVCRLGTLCFGVTLFICRLQTHIPRNKTGLLDWSSNLFSSFLVFVSARCAHTHVCVETTGWPRVFSSIRLHFIFWRQAFSLNLELAISARWAVQRAPGTCSPPPPSSLAQHPTFTWVPETQTQIPRLMQLAPLPTHHLPLQPLIFLNVFFYITSRELPFRYLSTILFTCWNLSRLW